MDKKTLMTTAVVALVAALIGGYVAGLVGNNQQELGATGTRFPNGLSTNSTSPAAGELQTTTLEVDSTSSFEGVASFAAQPKFDAGSLHSYPLSTSTPASLTLAASDVTNYESVVMLPTVGSITVTLPASSTLSAFVPTAGDWAEQCYTNATSTASFGITLAGGTGTNLLVASSSATAVGSKILLPGKTGCIKYFRIGAGANASDINAILTVFN